jgi:hypothetical protein
MVGSISGGAYKKPEHNDSENKTNDSTRNVPRLQTDSNWDAIDSSADPETITMPIVSQSIWDGRKSRRWRMNEQNHRTDDNRDEHSDKGAH